MQLGSPGILKALPSWGEAFWEDLKARAGSLDDLRGELPRLDVPSTVEHVLLWHFL